MLPYFVNGINYIIFEQCIDGADWALTPKNVLTQKAVKRSKTFAANYCILPLSEKA
jgi:hypothetical protein